MKNLSIYKIMTSDGKKRIGIAIEARSPEYYVIGNLKWQDGMHRYDYG